MIAVQVWMIFVQPWTAAVHVCVFFVQPWMNFLQPLTNQLQRCMNGVQGWSGALPLWMAGR